MSDATYTPPAVWTWNKENGGRFAAINRPIAGSTKEHELPVGKHPMQLYSLGTPNGVKVSIMLEETGLPYEPHLVSFETNDQMSPEFLSLNPNNKIPAILDPDGPGGKPLALFESGAILVYLAEKTGKLIPQDAAGRYQTLQWVMFQMGGIGPMFGQLGFFNKFAGKDYEDKRRDAARWRQRGNHRRSEPLRQRVRDGAGYCDGQGPAGEHQPGRKWPMAQSQLQIKRQGKQSCRLGREATHRGDHRHTKGAQRQQIDRPERRYARPLPPDQRHSDNKCRAEQQKRRNRLTDRHACRDKDRRCDR
eukprot:gene4521-6189_t